MAKLFKDSVNKSESENFADRLLTAITDGSLTTTTLLFGTDSPIRYDSRGTYEYGGHATKECSGFSSAPYREDEKRVCKCLFYYNLDKKTKFCQNCVFEDRYIVTNFKITDYELPGFYKPEQVGNIDIVIKLNDSEALYATEVKPYAGNEEPLIRMIAEIMTYTDGYGNKFKKAIGFFENSPQHDEYTALPADSKLRALLNAAKISVFLFKRDMQKGELSIDPLLRY